MAGNGHAIFARRKQQIGATVTQSFATLESIGAGLPGAPAAMQSAYG